ncbi:urease accessory protein UreE [Cyanobacterium aponinum UTEX 3221]|uniref:urease accessory protein UreE n=1 Tax=Cyanobacterium aponinum TaxID=379064 RepID=UPI002B4C182F|nr:urease accessory protein UreE [Cyanobacterium aponinum]WRL39206.1 urease accessory protein UreE [Cyanobacterium aponinum UTEX 3221]
MIILTKKSKFFLRNKVNLEIYLTAEERTKVKQKIRVDTISENENKYIKLNLERGNVLMEGDILTNDDESFFVEIKAKSEPVITVKASNTLDLLKAAYHLGNRHVSLEINSDYLRFSPDHVLESMLSKLGVSFCQETAPFYPELGAYKHEK